MDPNAPKVLFVTHKYPPSLGGMQRQSFELTSNYMKIGKASLIAYNSRYPVSLFFLIVIPWILLRLLKDREIEVIHGNDGLMGIFLTPFLASRRKVFLTVHGLDVYLGARVYQWWVRTFLKRFDAVIAVSVQTAEGCIVRGVAPEKVSTVLNACDKNWTHQKDPAFAQWLRDKHGIDPSTHIVITSAGRPVPRKGFSWFAAHVMPKLPENVVYVVAGPVSGMGLIMTVLRRALPRALFESVCHAVGAETDSAKLIDLADGPDLKGRLVLAGPMTRKPLNQMYLHSRIFVMPNLRIQGDFEGFGLVIQEATYNGALCLAADADGIPSAIRDRETGILLPSGDVDAWAAEINALCANPDELQLLARTYQANLQDGLMTWADVARSYQRIFAQPEPAVADRAGGL